MRCARQSQAQGEDRRRAGKSGEEGRRGEKSGEERGRAGKSGEERGRAEKSGEERRRAGKCGEVRGSAGKSGRTRGRAVPKPGPWGCGDGIQSGRGSSNRSEAVAPAPGSSNWGESRPPGIASGMELRPGSLVFTRLRGFHSAQRSVGRVGAEPQIGSAEPKPRRRSSVHKPPVRKYPACTHARTLACARALGRVRLRTHAGNRACTRVRVNACANSPGHVAQHLRDALLQRAGRPATGRPRGQGLLAQLAEELAGRGVGIAAALAVGPHQRLGSRCEGARSREGCACAHKCACKRPRVCVRACECACECVRESAWSWERKSTSLSGGLAARYAALKALVEKECCASPANLPTYTPTPQIGATTRLHPNAMDRYHSPALPRQERQLRRKAPKARKAAEKAPVRRSAARTAAGNRIMGGTDETPPTASRKRHTNSTGHCCYRLAGGGNGVLLRPRKPGPALCIEIRCTPPAREANALWSAASDLDFAGTLVVNYLLVLNDSYTVDLTRHRELRANFPLNGLLHGHGGFSTSVWVHDRLRLSKNAVH